MNKPGTYQRTFPEDLAALGEILVRRQKLQELVVGRIAQTLIDIANPQNPGEHVIEDIDVNELGSRIMEDLFDFPKSEEEEHMSAKIKEIFKNVS